MSFKMKYNVQADYLPMGTKRRSGQRIPRVGFVVAHDTGNPGSTARNNVNYYKNSPTISASAHIFVDHKDIIECIPALTGAPEKAWHVLYNVTKDNAMYGDDANDIAIGVEMCWGKGIDSGESYKRFVWVMAYICHKFGLDPAKAIVGHEVLDPKRKVDPSNGLKYMGRLYAQMLKDVVTEYKECRGQGVAEKPQKVSNYAKTHTVVRGETMYSISKTYGKTVGQLMALNPNIDVHKIKVGDKIITDSGVGVTPTVEKEVPKELQKYLDKPPIRPYPGQPLRRGAKGKDVEAVQRALRITVDGSYGPATVKAVNSYQAKFKFLEVNGTVDFNTWNVMF